MVLWLDVSNMSTGWHLFLVGVICLYIGVPSTNGMVNATHYLGVPSTSFIRRGKEADCAIRSGPNK